MWRGGVSVGLLPRLVSLSDAAGDWASYFWSGSIVPRNKLNLHDRDELQQQEYRYVAGRQTELQLGTVSIPRTFDAEHLRNIHRHLFQDVYDWAGQYRTVPLAKDIREFAAPNRIATYLDGAASWTTRPGQPCRPTSSPTPWPRSTLGPTMPSVCGSQCGAGRGRRPATAAVLGHVQVFETAARTTPGSL